MTPTHISETSNVASEASLGLLQEDALGCLFEFLDAQDLLQIEGVNVRMQSFAQNTWQQLAQSLSMEFRGLSLGEDKCSKEGVISFLRAKQVAQKMERLRDYHDSNLNWDFDDQEQPHCLGCTQMPAMLTLDGLTEPSNYDFFVRISKKQPCSSDFELYWEGFLPFIIDEDLGDGSGVRRRISCDIQEHMPEIIQKCEPIDALLKRGVSYYEFADDAFDTDIGQNLFITVVTFRQQEGYKVSEPRLLVSARGFSHFCGDMDTVDGEVEWGMNFQHVMTHEQENTGLFGSMSVSFKTENREITDLSLRYYVQ